MAQPEIHDQAAAYALDALGPEDRWTYERHLDTCDRCREEVGTLRDTAVELAYAAEGPEPSAELRARILAAAETEPRTATVLQTRRRWLLPATAAAAAVAACAAIGLGLWANSLRDQGAEQRVIPMVGGGSLIVADGEATIVACVEDPPAGKTYEAWVFEAGTPRPAGLFSGGCRSVPLERRVDEGDRVAVTLEDAGGAEAPQGEILMRADV